MNLTFAPTKFKLSPIIAFVKAFLSKLGEVGNYNMLRIIFSRNFWKTSVPWKIIGLSFILLAGIGVLPTLYLNGWLDSYILLETSKIADYPTSYYQIVEFTPWLVIILTSFLILLLNTLYYIVVLFSDLVSTAKNNLRAQLSYFGVVVCLLLVLALTFVFFYRAIKHETAFSTLLENPPTNLAEPKFGKRTANDGKFKKDLADLFSKIVKDAETFTLCFFGIFIIMDIFSILGKKSLNQLGAVVTEQEKIERQSLVQQLWLIDVPVFFGIFFSAWYINRVNSFQMKPESLYIFIVGAVAMHIIYSQFVFFILNVAFLFNSYKIKQANPTEA